MSTLSPRERALQKRQQREAQARTTDVWSQLRSRFEEGKILPIVGNSVLNDMVFPSLVPVNNAPSEGRDRSAAVLCGPLVPQEQGEAPSPEEKGAVQDETNGEQMPPSQALMPCTVDEMLANLLAVEYGYPYPFADFSSLARVTQFISYARQLDRLAANEAYLRFLKEWLLDLAEGDPEAAQGVASLRRKVDEPGTTFSNLAGDLGYPRTPPGRENPLDLLAQLRLPVYLTTSYYKFLERALHDVGRPPHTHVCYWNREPTSGEKEGDTPAPYPDFVPDVNHPVVYHLYVVETDPESLVLTEDDYLRFLIKATNQDVPILPTYLTTQLAESSLILVGYRPQDWDFRILARGIISCCTALASDDIKKSIAIQLEPIVRDEIEDRRRAEQDAETYLQEYFDKLNFKIQWSDVYTFTAELFALWKDWSGVHP